MSGPHKAKLGSCQWPERKVVFPDGSKTMLPYLGNEHT